MDVDDVRLGIKMVVPDVFEQHGSGNNLAVVAHQIFQQSKLPGLKLDDFSVTTNLSGQYIHLQIGYLELRSHYAMCWARRPRASTRASNSSKAKGFGR